MSHHYPFRVGTFDCIVVSDGVSAFRAALVFGNAPEDERDRILRDRGMDTEMVQSSLNALVVNTGSNLILIDTGIGPFTDQTGKLMTNLRSADINPDDIDTVILTHGHPDHIGGNVDDQGNPAFPNARYLMRRQEWEFWTSESNLERLAAGELHGIGEIDQFMGLWARNYLPPIADRFDLLDIQNEDEIVPGIRALPLPRHSPHQMGLIIESDGERLLCPVDVAINPIHLAEPGWHPAFDWQPEIALQTRRQIFDRITAEGALAFVYHYPFPGLGHVHPEGKGWRWEPIDS